ncbi:MAG: aldo/keto reductase [Dehalococcoidales bacterium]|nr:aldo/keto reductase [Dehalococcoidales bacterium]
MKMRFLGKTGLQVSELCLGTGSFGGRSGYERTGTISQEEADAIVNMCLDTGINFFDTAETYSDGWAEEILGNALVSRRKEAVVVTKVHPSRSPGPNDGGFSRKHIIEGCDASLKRLRTDYVDVYELHMFDEHTPLEVTLRALDDLVRAGKVRYIGCSNFSAWQVMKSLAISDRNGLERFMTLEAMYNLTSRWLEFELVPLCLDQGVGILAFSPLHGGYLSGKYSRNQPWPRGARFVKAESTGAWPVKLEELYNIVDVLAKIAEQHNTTISHTALNYLLRKPGVSSLIIGIRTIKQLEENISATEWTLTPDEVEMLDRVSEPERKNPYYIYNPVKEKQAKK